STPPSSRRGTSQQRPISGGFLIFVYPTPVASRRETRKTQVSPVKPGSSRGRPLTVFRAFYIESPSSREPRGDRREVRAMKLKILIMPLVVAALAAPAALSANTSAAKRAVHCARVAVILKGTIAATPAKGATQFALKVNATNRHGAAVMGDSLTITTNAHTKIILGGKRTTLDALQANDTANV